MKKNNLIIFVIIILALFGFIFYPWVILPLKNFSQNIFLPVSLVLAQSSNSLQNYFSKISSISKLNQENNQLSQNNLELKAKLAQSEELKHENEILRKELNFLKDKNIENLIPAQIIAYSPNAYVRSIKLNKGSKDGVKKNQAVISSGFLVGIITEVYNDNSDVLFITGSTSLIPIVLQNSRATGLLQGGLKGLIVREIPLDSNIEKGEMVLTSGLGGDLPNSVPIGKVTKIISAESEIFQKVQIESPIQFNNLEIVFIMK